MEGCLRKVSRGVWYEYEEMTYDEGGTGSAENDGVCGLVGGTLPRGAGGGLLRWRGTRGGRGELS